MEVGQGQNYINDERSVHFLEQKNRECLNEFAEIPDDKCLSETYCHFIRGDTFLSLNRKEIQNYILNGTL